MMNLKDAKKNLDIMLSMYLDQRMHDSGFARKKSEFKYKSTSKESRQIIDFTHSRPRYKDDKSDLHIKPNLGIYMKEVNDLALEIAGSERLLGGLVDFTIYENIGILGPKASFVDWRPVGSEKFMEIGVDIANYFFSWVIPFFNEYKTPEDLIRGFEKGDSRLPRGNSWFLRISAAYMLLGRGDKAKDLIIDAFVKKPGLSKIYHPVISYFNIK